MKRLFLLLLIAFALPMAMRAQTTIPNGDFENWNITTHDEPDSGWFTSNAQSIAQDGTANVTKVTGYSGSAIHIQTGGSGPNIIQAFITNTPGDPTKAQGGIPFSQKPGALTGYYRCGEVGQDSGILLVIFKKGGIPMGAPYFYKFGGSISTFTKFKMPFSPALSATPDSVIIAAASSNLISQKGISAGSWLELDQIQFGGGNGTGTTYPIPGGSFDNWTTDSVDVPQGWTELNGNNAIFRSPSHESGSYSAMLVTVPSMGGNQPLSPASMTTGTFSQKDTNSGPKGGQPYTLTADSLTGYYKYIPQGTDSGSVNVELSKKGSPVGGGEYHFGLATQWTRFSFPIQAGQTPDTMRVDVSSSNYPIKTNKPGSALYLDLISLKSAPLHNSGLQIVTASQFGISAYPNPANNNLQLSFKNQMPAFSIRVYDINGRMVISERNCANASNYILNVQSLNPGTYIYEITTKDEAIKDKFIKE